MWERVSASRRIATERCASAAADSPTHAWSSPADNSVIGVRGWESIRDLFFRFQQDNEKSSYSITGSPPSLQLDGCQAAGLNGGRLPPSAFFERSGAESSRLPQVCRSETCPQKMRRRKIG